MIDRFSLGTHRALFALALFAVLATAVVQSAEVAHAHGQDDVGELCLVYKLDSGDAAVGTAYSATPLVSRRASHTTLRLALHSYSISLKQARAPPSLS